MFKRNTAYLQKQAKYLLKRCKIVTKKHKVARKERKNNQGRDAKQPQREMRIAAIYWQYKALYQRPFIEGSSRWALLQFAPQNVLSLPGSEKVDAEWIVCIKELNRGGRKSAVGHSYGTTDEIEREGGGGWKLRSTYRQREEKEEPRGSKKK